MLISSGNTLTDTHRHHVLPAIWAFISPVMLTHKINHHSGCSAVDTNTGSGWDPERTVDSTWTETTSPWLWSTWTCSWAQTPPSRGERGRALERGDEPLWVSFDCILILCQHWVNLKKNWCKTNISRTPVPGITGMGTLSTVRSVT